MAVNLMSVNNIKNIHIAKYIADTEAEKDNISDEDRVQGTEVLVIEGNKRYRLDCNLQWVEIVSQGGGGGGSGGPSVTIEPISITQNGQTIAPYGKAYSPVNVNVPNTYIAGDEGKVVSNGALVAQAAHSTITQNGTYDTTLNDSVEIDVPPVGAEAPKRDINFIDYDGKILYSYSTEDFLDLEELPETPTYDNLISEGWNWTLTDAKEYVTNYGKLWIGQTYDTISGMTEIDIRIPEGRTEICLTLEDASNQLIDWGDNTSSLIPSSISTNSINHTYLESGFYTIKIPSISDWPIAIRGDENSEQSQLITKPNGTIQENIIYLGFIEAIRASNIRLLDYCFVNCYNLKTITTSKNTILGSDIYYWDCTNCYSLKSVSMFDGPIPILKNCYSLKNLSGSNEFYVNNHLNEHFRNCTALKNITLSEYGGYIYQNQFNNCAILEEIYINCGSQIQNGAFQDCQNLLSVTIYPDITEIKTKAFYNCTGLKEIHFKGRIPPAIYASDVFYRLPTDCIIYVPIDRLETYMYTTNYPNSSVYTYVEEA